jgi:hypothetical protein
MLAAIGAKLDHRVTLMIASRARRRWPLLRLVPAAMMLPLLAPIGRRVRTSVVRVATIGVSATGIVSVILLVVK